MNRLYQMKTTYKKDKKKYIYQWKKIVILIKLIRKIILNFSASLINKKII